MDQSLLDEFATECRRAVQRLVDEYGFSRERAKRLVFAELASARAPSPNEVSSIGIFVQFFSHERTLQVFQAMKEYELDWDRGYELMSVAAAARNSPEKTAIEFIHRLRNLEPRSNSSEDWNAASRRSMSFSVATVPPVVPQKKRTMSETSMEMESSDLAIKRPAQKILKKE